MLPASISLDVCRKNSFYLLGAIILLCTFSSCKKSPDPSYGYTNAFKKINDTTDQISIKDPYRALKYLDSAFATLKNPSFNDRFRLLANHFFMKQRTTRDFKGALIIADSMLNYVNVNGGQSKLPSNFAEANFAKGDAFYELHDYNDAYRYYYNGYETGKDHIDNNVLSGYSYRMGMISYQQFNYDNAANFFKESFNKSLPMDSQFAIFFRNQEVLDNIGLSYRHLDKTDSALIYFDKAEKYIADKAPHFQNKETLLTIAAAVIQGNEADIYINRGNYLTASELLKKSIAVNILKGGDNSDAMLSEIKLAKLYKDQNNPHSLSGILDTINSQLQNIPDSAKTIDNKKVEADWFLLKSNLYEKYGNLELALKYSQRYIVLNDYLAQSIHKLKEINIADKSNSYDKDAQIETLTRYTRLQKIYLIVSCLAGLLAFVIILMIYRNWRYSKNEISMISRLNKEVNRQKEDLETTLNKLNNSILEKDRILHTVAHDLRNPLSGIASLANIMAEDDLKEQELEYINLIKETADNSLQLISEIFEATEAGIGNIELQPVNVNALLHSVVGLLKFKAAEKNQQIILTPFPGTKNVMANREKLWRVISNLLVNAIKFSPSRSNVFIETSETNAGILIRIKDNGIGISDDLKPKVFNMFTEAKRVGTMGEKSFGLGLSISRQIIEKHGGKLWLEDNPDGGSIFCISLKEAV